MNKMTTARAKAYLTWDRDKLVARIAELEAALKVFAAVKADDGDDFSGWDDKVIIRCEVTVGDLRKARETLNAKS